MPARATIHLAEPCCRSKRNANPPVKPSGSVCLRFRLHARQVLSIAGAIVAVMLPKCPLCIMAWAAAWGIGAAGQSLLALPFAPQLRPIIIALLVVPLLLQVVVGVRVVLPMLWRRAVSLRP